MLVTFDTLPDHSRIWIFPANRSLSHTESAELSTTIEHYLSSWEAHHVPVEAAYELCYNQFLVIAANPDVTAPSGCSIDDMTRAIKALGTKFNIDFFGAMKIFYRDGEAIRSVSRTEFRELALAGAVDAETVVFDNSLTSIDALRNGRWEIPASESWHASLLPALV